MNGAREFSRLGWNGRAATVAALALALAGLPGSSQAQTAAPPANTVRCVYESLSPEDLEMALLLMAREIGGKGAFDTTSRNMKLVDRLLEEAHGKCLARYAWSIGRSEAAKGYALTALLGDGVYQALDSFGEPVAKIDEFFAANRAALAGRTELSPAMRQRLFAFLKEQGWAKDKQDELDLAAVYLETLMVRDSAQRFFSASGGTGRQPSSRPRARAGKASRGRP